MGKLIQRLETVYDHSKLDPYGKYHFIVSDNGMGMSAVILKKLSFDAFTRAESSVTNKIQGTGLGNGNH